MPARFWEVGGERISKHHNFPRPTQLPTLFRRYPINTTMPPLHDHYRILGISDDASQETIKTAFRKLALKYHPDKNSGPEAIEIFAALHKAYTVLSDPEKKRAYDLSRPGKPRVEMSELAARSVTDKTQIRLTVDKRVLRLDETVQVTVSVFQRNTKIFLSGLHQFELLEGPNINSLFPPGNNNPEIEVTYILKPKQHGYIEIGPASFVADGVKYLSQSMHIKVDPTPDLITRRPVSKMEIFQGITYVLLVAFYTVLISFNIYQYKIYPFTRDTRTPYIAEGPILMGYAQLPTGATPFNHFYGPGRYDNGSPNRIVLHNDKSRDVVVMLMDSKTKQPVRNNYIRAGDDLIMGNIPDGSYYLKALFGNDWNKELTLSEDAALRGGFSKNVRYEIFEREISITRMQQSSGAVDYKIYEITLYPVQQGNTQSLTADAKKFFAD